MDSDWECGKYQPMPYAALAKVIRESQKRAGIKKKVSPYLLRHSRLTFLAKILTEQELKIIVGLVQASKMASTYVHLSARDADAAILGEVYGIAKKEEEKAATELKPITCP